MALALRISRGLRYAFVNPVIAMLLGVGIGGALVARGEWAAVAVVLAGVLLLMWKRAH